MKVYTTDKIRNVVLLGHGGCGKTTLAEAMAYLSGIVSRPGKVEDGSTISDCTKEETKRQISISTAVVPVEWDDFKINVLDTPGFFDFEGEVNEAMSVADGAIIVVSGKAGVEAGTERAWDICEKYHLPRIFFITDMDIDSVSYRQVLDDLNVMFGKKIAPFNMPLREEEKLAGYINVIQKKAFRYQGEEAVEEEVPDYSVSYLNQYNDSLMEAVAETSEEFLDRYLSGDSFSEAEIRAAVRSAISDGSIIPVESGSGVAQRGVYTLLDDIVKYMPSADNRKMSGINAQTNEIFEANFDVLKPKTAFVFKTIADPFIGFYSLIKIRSGVVKADDMMYDVRTGNEFKIGKLYVLRGNKATEVPELHAGDLGALAKQTAIKTGDTLSTKNNPVVYAKMDLPSPYTCLRWKPVNKGDVDKIAMAMQKIAAEDQTFRFERDNANRQSLIYGMGDLHLEIIQSRLLNEYKAEIKTERPKVAFRETIKKRSDVEFKYKKQTGGHGQYGHVKMRFGPSGTNDPYVFDEEVVGGAVPKNFFPAVEKGIAAGCERGPLAGYPVVGVHATLYDGSYHSVDSSENSFKIAAEQCFKKGIMEAGAVLLEPFVMLKVTVPDSYIGDVIGDLNKRRGSVMGMTPTNGKQVIEAEIPQMELFGYSTVLRSMTGGRGDFSYEFSRYDQAPEDVQSKAIAAYQEKLAASDSEE
ncbi:translation factor GTPase family protein [Anaerovibrio sp. RM50]|uniref:elongation factor G n=1 Tax=Anaerovibrio sp. RM50 TaxID=1200557 RepID=UPI00048177A1|nr:elongation factor G [Anaerovibrio sp. RM50]